MYGMHAVKLGLLLVLIGGAAVAGEGPGDATGERDGGEQGEQKNEESLIAQKEEAPLAFKIGDDSDDFDNNDDSIQQHKKKPDSSKQAKNSTSAKAIKSRRRIQSHILLIGDPGTGKSQFLRFAAALSPRSVLTTGTGSSTAGLTCAAVRDSGAGASGKDFSLEAGALALADRGVCCIDEFGCMSQQDRTSIHEAMEQQTISVAKAGIVCKLNARTSVVAVMNPKDGIYDAGQTLAVNSKLGSALLSRFDLVFVMLDQAVDVSLDQAESRIRDANIARFLLQQSIKHGSGYDRLLEIETLTDDDAANGHWSLEKLRAYIATIRKNFQPVITPEASELLEKHYSLCRSQNDQSLVTVRFLESLIRLSQAHARLMYRGKVLLDDAVAVILLMECTPAALGGGMFAGPGSGPSDGYDDLNKNPIATEFRPFDEADAMFEDEKEKLLQRYRNTHNNGRHCKDQSWDQSWNNDGRCPAQHHAISEQSGQGGNDSRDHYGRQIMSQATSPHVRQTRENMMSPSEYIPPSSNCSVRHQYETRVSFHQEDLAESMHRSDNEHCSRFKTGNHIQRYDASMSQNSSHQYNYPISQQHGESFEAGDQFCHHDHTCHDHAQPKNQIQGYTAASNQNERYRINDDGINVSPGYPSARPFQQNGSGTRHKKRRTAD